MAVASLPMYDLPELRAATDAWWQGLARAFRREGIEDVPVQLDRRPTYRDVWQLPDLLFSQTCGYPLTHVLAGRVELLATPCYAADGCKGPSYCSLIVVGEDHPVTTIADLRGARVAINSRDSQSGYSVLRSAVAPHARKGRYFASVTESGSHIGSLGLVAAGAVDVAAIDCVTHALLAEYRPAVLQGTRILERTASAPGLPYVTGSGLDPDRLDRLRTAVQRAFADPQLLGVRDALLLTGAPVLPLSAYERITELERAAIAAGYPEIA